MQALDKKKKSKIRRRRRQKEYQLITAVKPFDIASRPNHQLQSQSTDKPKALKYINRCLKIINILLALYLIVSPFLPNILLKYSQSLDKTKGYKYQSKLAQTAQEGGADIDQNLLKPKPLINTLVIPAIGVDADILEGSDVATLDKGIWRRPLTSSPDKGGNTVLTGHRFMYTYGPNTFYSLDKLKEGDKILVFWESKEYIYEVFAIKVVTPTEISIEDNTSESMVTLFTCTPLWTSKDRLVVKAKLLQQ